jgi:hypothetical protein
VRQRSAQALGKRNDDVVPEVVKLLAGPEPDTRYGACQALACLGKRADPAGPQLRALLRDPDPWLAALACYAIARLSPEMTKASINDLLILAGGKNPADPRETVKRAAADVLFGYGGGRGFLQESVKDIDRRLLYPSIRSILENDNGAARGTLTHYKIYDKLDDRDLAVLLPAIITSIDQVAPSNEMFADAIRLSGLDLISRLHIREGMALCVSVIEMDRWGKKDRIPVCLSSLLRYGHHAKAVVPQLKAALSRASAADAKTYQAVFEKAISDIEASTDKPDLMDAAEFIARNSPGGAEAAERRK